MEGVYVHVGSSVHNTVAFLGFRSDAHPGGIRCEGTGFFLGYDETGYLVTARHVASLLDGSPFVMRVNRRGGEADLLDVDDAVWHFPADPNDDLAITEFAVPKRAGYDINYIGSLATADVIRDLQIDVGDMCYTVGLFRHLYGKRRNFPLVHSGNIALMPPSGEKIPVSNHARTATEYLEGYLIESRAIGGASGSPVFVRSSYRLQSLTSKVEGREISPLLADGRVFLLGVFTGAWFAPPDENLAREIKRAPVEVPIGFGVVAPVSKIVEILESKPVKNRRDQARSQVAAKQTGAAQEHETNPDHKEDFTSLLNAAARTPKQDD